ncbi:ATP-dependent DNA/RNA helicase DHX36-like [Galleria mellonella]|uniref:RNA helicase n=1 Tax=Galleria mellonella TaxID=7137 RepID=A0ABM3N021_GALME|nr:ATP-dependent DNA/RNA helicase DHX36-like [Galleria mellonella]
MNMSQQGKMRDDGSHHDGSWHSWGQKHSLIKRHPPGLRGKEIGLFYRNQQKKHGKKAKEFKFHLNVPKSIVVTLKNKLQVIAKLTTYQDISLIKKIKDGDEKSTKCVVPEFIEPKKELPCSEDDNSKNSHNSKDIDDYKFIKPNSKPALVYNNKPSTSKLPDFIPVSAEPTTDQGNEPRILSLRGAGDYKYSYEDIITGTFKEKLEECLSKGVKIRETNNEINDLSIALYEDYKDMLKRSSYKKLMQFREKLPTYKKSKDLLDVINNNQVIVVSGETGCGKSTQVPQIILDDAILNNKGANVKILVTQPRRIAALSLASRVAEERAESMGSSVGYAVRLEKIESRERGGIMYCTTGILLVDLEVNQGLTNYSHIILDEVHERDCHIDFAMCMLKEVRNKILFIFRGIVHKEFVPPGKTVNQVYYCQVLERLRKRVNRVRPDIARNWILHHDNAPCHTALSVSQYLASKGIAVLQQPPYSPDMSPCDFFLFPKTKSVVKGTHFESITDIQAAVTRVLADIPVEAFQKCYEAWKTRWNRCIAAQGDYFEGDGRSICKGDPGAILVFLPGIGDITKLIKQMNRSGHFPSSRYDIHPLHSKLSSIEQRKIFERPPEHIRKIIIATNIAETSITVDDIVYVIDCGRIKCTGLNVEDNISTLQVEWVSQANLRQRRGRAGRCQPGICLLKDHLVKFVPSTETFATCLIHHGRVILTIQWAVKHLQKKKQCGALDESERLTPLGWHMARLPLHPAAGKLLLLAALFGCLDRAASLAAVWSFKDPFLLVIGKEREVEIAKRELTLGEPSDHVAMSEAVLRWERLREREGREFAYRYFLSVNTLELLSDMKKQLGDNLKNMGFLPSGDVKASWENRNADNISLFKAIVAAALYPNIGTVRWTGTRGRNAFKKQMRIKVRTPEDGPIELHPSSVMCAPPHNSGPIRSLCTNPGANWLVYRLKQLSSRLFLLDVTLVYTLPLLFFGELKVIKEEKIEDETDLNSEEEDRCQMTISTYKVQCNQDTTDVLFELRKLLDQVLASKIMVNSNHAEQHNEFEEKVLNAVVELITAEDEGTDYYKDEDDDTASDTSDCEFDRRRLKKY